jgi:hypothetical protein
MVDDVALSTVLAGRAAIGEIDNPDALLIDVASNGRYVRNVLSEATTKMKARNATETPPSTS